MTRGKRLEVHAEPSKRFFVSMLTRDIDLEDAILDLLDNCLDGVLRDRAKKTRRPKSNTKPYAKYWARITASPDEFKIEDNCGGIPKELARNVAFRLGRPDKDERDSQIETVGVYGIGMKRAIFKLGEQCTVSSRTAKDNYDVQISPKWLTNDDDWKLPLTERRRSGNRPAGTTIHVTQLHKHVANQFAADQDDFLNRLARLISEFYAVIISKGFVVTLNGDKIEGVENTVLFPKNFADASAIAPYAYKTTVGDVDVKLVVGFHRPLATDREIDRESRAPSKRDLAGWTIICNDRVVLHKDKSLVTGWGRGTVPRFHNQFIAITGVVVFTSKNSECLPLNTTKRGLDTSSLVYLRVLNRMEEGLKVFTDFTNKWKGRERETIGNFERSESVDLVSVVDSIPSDNWRAPRGTRSEGGKRFNPKLPKPPSVAAFKKIMFTRPAEEVELIGRKFLSDSAAAPGDVGEFCFQRALEEIQMPAKKASKKPKGRR